MLLGSGIPRNTSALAYYRSCAFKHSFKLRHPVTHRHIIERHRVEVGGRIHETLHGLKKFLELLPGFKYLVQVASLLNQSDLGTRSSSEAAIRQKAKH